jgi:hypothetical protein
MFMKKMLWVLYAALLFSCQTSKITVTWTDKNVSPKKYNKILVLGILKDDDRELQSKMEKHLAGDLNDLGYSAFAASDVFPSGTFIKGDTAKAIEALNSKGFDAVLTVVLLNKEKEKQYIPGRVISTPYAPYHDRLDLYYYSMQDRIQTEGYYESAIKFFWESNFYDRNSKKMLYSSQTESFDSGSKENLAHYYGVLVANNLVKRKILIRPEEPRF